MRNLSRNCLLAAAAVSALGILAGRQAQATTYTYTTFADPATSWGTFAYGINNAGQVVGYYNNNFVPTAFLYSNGTFTTIGIPGAARSWATGINDAGQIAGWGDWSFRRETSGTFTLINDPLGSALAYGINDAGQVVGTLADYGYPYTNHGFLYSNGTFTTITDPLAWGYNRPNEGTQAYGINNAGQIVGTYHDYDGAGNDITHGYVRDKNGTFTTITVPGSFETDAYDINDLGQIVGYFYGAAGWLGFVATPVVVPPPPPVPEPVSITVLGTGLLGLGLAKRFRKIGKAVPVDPVQPGRSDPRCRSSAAPRMPLLPWTIPMAPLGCA